MFCILWWGKQSLRPPQNKETCSLTSGVALCRIGSLLGNLLTRAKRSLQYFKFSNHPSVQGFLLFCCCCFLIASCSDFDFYCSVLSALKLFIVLMMPLVLMILLLYCILNYCNVSIWILVLNYLGYPMIWKERQDINILNK